MLKRLGLGCFDGLFRCRPSIIPLRSIHHHVPTSGHHRKPSELPPAATADDPAGWILLNKRGIRADDAFVAEADTVAYCHVFMGRLLRVSLRRAPPPASTFIYYDFPYSTPGEDDKTVIDEYFKEHVDMSEEKHDESVEEEEEEEEDVDESEKEEAENVDEWGIHVVAAHCDLVLLELSHEPCDHDSIHLLYRAGAAKRPSLALLPERDFLTKSEQLYTQQVFSPYSGDTCLVRRGDILLVELYHMYDRSLQQDMAEFCLLRHGARQWELKEPVPMIIQDEGSTERPRTRGGRDTIVPLGNRFVCWVRYETGFLLCDMGDEECPKVRYVPLPPGVCWDPKEYDDGNPKYSMNMGAAGDGASVVRFVSVDPHCCCGGPGRSTCMRSRYAFTINTWTMNLSMDDPLVWVKDGEIDCEELWGQPGYEGLPKGHLQCPIVSLDDPNIVCFLVANFPFVSSYEDRKVWMIQLNIKTKALLSAVQYTKDLWGVYHHLPVQIQS
ncbi:hypothetical protein HU200_029120 [Digitaria exilis]|uniref:DUF1618 domain-containing protein n=1 Tax=Digitaria exilis TaxID=1010633 RepID=A0A835EP94_9POAL|nr:hypothetical protein HU200_029120 [Digitaria exilis]CAB3489289.1 unnamed protein product [Digitaria exilis]